jgi:homoserine dehydrogenase
LALIGACGADAMIEMTPIERDTGRMAIRHIETALNAGQHAITANKGPLAHDYRRLRDLAKQRGAGCFLKRR